MSPRVRRRAGLALAVFAVASELPSAGFAASRFFVGADGANWNTTASWSATAGGASGQTVPVANDVVSISGVTPRTVNYNGPNYLTPGLLSLTIDGTAASAMILNQATANDMFAATEQVGLSNRGTYT